MRNTIRTQKVKTNSGFTLIEMAISIVIISIVIIGLLPLFLIYEKSQRAETTETNLQTISGNINSFMTTYGRYPAPASATEVRGSLNYGREVDVTTPSLAGTAPGSCDASTGICVEQSIRTPSLTNARVLVGTIPFRELNMDESQYYDGYGNRYTYAITEDLTNSATFDPDIGGIAIQSTAGVSLVNPENSAHYIIISHGSNESGAYNREGIQITCAAGAENENCNLATDSIYQVAEYSTNSAAGSYYDDVVNYFTAAEMPTWQTSELNTSDIHLKAHVGNLGIRAVETDNVPEPGTIRGDVRSDVQIETDQICDAVGNCFRTELIAGDSPLMECPVGQFMIAIANGERQCVTEVTTRCPAGERMVGFNPDGTLNCALLPVSCPDDNSVTLCGVPQTLFAAPNGTPRTITAGDSRTQTFTCTNGSWISGGTNGVCSCTPSSVTSGPLFCGTGSTGTFTRTRGNTCGPFTPFDTNTRSTDCACDDTATRPRNAACNSGGVTGFNDPANARVTWTEQRVCSPNPAWVLVGTRDTSACRCRPDIRFQDFACPDGSIANPIGIRKQKEFTCPAGPTNPGVWDSTWQDHIDDCVCDSSKKRLRTETCGAGLQPGPDGPPRYSQQAICSGSVVSGFGPEILESGSCVPIPPVVCNWSVGSFNGSGPIEPSGSLRISSSTGTCSDCGTSVPKCHTANGSNFNSFLACSCE